MHPFEMKCDELTYAMSVPFIVLDNQFIITKSQVQSMIDSLYL